MNCPKPLGKDGPEPVLLIPGTASTPESAFGWNSMKAFREEGTPFCSVTLPDEANADIQRSAEYVVHALRKMNSSSGKKVQIVGWSQGGGPLPRWALKFWPDTRHMVDNLIGIDPDNHGSAVVNLLGCGVINTFCSPALWQQRPDSHFISTLNRGGMTYPEVNYTVLYLNFSNVVEPSVHGESQSLPPGPNVTNVSLQGTCGGPLSLPSDHATAVGLPITASLIRATLSNPGRPLQKASINASACTKTLPAIQENIGIIANNYLQQFTRSIPRHSVPAEPALRAYARTTR
ncbi:esterase/lipase family protein [Tsukamurella pseudospumae]|uniref:Lipase n=1 Tax=Tsukamurella pseudospumae TaxID=239498 RepID=A0A138AN20_9ACTN|nr:hypothetical protein [Tsukamurella pseudospumae]KXP11843.1 hypothetical protein AXK60_24250 [Tsukamurella pseudospumae]